MYQEIEKEYDRFYKKALDQKDPEKLEIYLEFLESMNKLLEISARQSSYQ
jgi:hypothetical protein